MSLYYSTDLSYIQLLDAVLLKNLTNRLLDSLRPTVVAIRVWVSTISRGNVVGTCLVRNIYKIDVLVLLNYLSKSLLHKVDTILLALLVCRQEVAVLTIDCVEEDNRNVRATLAYSLDKRTNNL